jgi:hypothetical protein
MSEHSSKRVRGWTGSHVILLKVGSYIEGRIEFIVHRAPVHKLKERKELVCTELNKVVVVEGRKERLRRYASGYLWLLV